MRNLVIAFLIICVIVLVHGSDKYGYLEHVHFIVYDENFLFRGGEPRNKSNVFAYDQLVQEMNQSALNSSVVLPESFLLYDINLLDPSKKDEEADIIMERDWFAAHPDKGSFINYEIVGEKKSPSFYKKKELKELAISFDQWSADKLPAFLETIHATVTAESTVPTFTYIHCMCGCDRTGEVAGAYYMQYMGYSFKEAHDLDKEIAGREIETPSLNALTWFCYYLKYAQMYDLTCEK